MKYHTRFNTLTLYFLHLYMNKINYHFCVSEQNIEKLQILHLKIGLELGLKVVELMLTDMIKRYYYLQLFCLFD